MYYVPLACMLPSETDSIVAAGRCIDADPVALSSVRVIDPCIAMGAAAAHALDIAGLGSVHRIDIVRLHQRVHDDLVRQDRAPLPGLEPLPPKRVTESDPTNHTHLDFET